MSSVSNIKNLSARVAVKVPHPDSMIEVRMMPPESNFEVKVTPGGETIELIIHPGCSQIEVRITQPGDPDKSRIAVSSKTEPESLGLEKPDGTDAEEAGMDRAIPPECSVVEEDVVPGVSKAEFAVMIEEEAAGEAKRLLAEMGASESSTPSAALSATDCRPSLQASERLSLQEPGAAVGGLSGVDGFTAKAASDETFDGRLQAQTAAASLPVLKVDAAGDDESYTSAVEDDLRMEAPGPAQPESSEEDTAAMEMESASAVLASMVEEQSVIPEAVEEAARQALATLSQGGYDRLDLKKEPKRPAVNGREEEKPAVTNPSEQVVDRTIMVEYIEDNESGSQYMPDDTSTPLPEEDQMDLGPVEVEDEELAIGPIDLCDVEVDLERSRPADSVDGEAVIRARPLVTALPNNTIIPQ